MAKTLLLADDSVTIQKVVGISFASEDVTLITVDNGDDAIAKAKEHRPDAILADVVMPGKSGYEVCEAVKSDPALQHIPVLLLTGTFESFDEERAKRCGAAGHVAKPFEAQALVEQVRALFNKPAAPKPAAAPAPEPTSAAPASASLAAPTPQQGPTSDGSEGFDFFDDDLGDLAPAEPAAANAEAERQEADPMASDSAFAFGGDEIGAAQPERQASRAAAPEPRSTLDRTVAILPDEIEAELDGAAVPMAAPDAAPEPARPAAAVADLLPDTLEGPPEPTSPPADDLFDFDIGDSPAAPEGDLTPPVRGEDLAEATVIDPKGASGYDVSSSDLGDPLPAGLFGEALAAEDSLAMPVFGEPLGTDSRVPGPGAKPMAAHPPIEPRRAAAPEPMATPRPVAPPPAPEPVAVADAQWPPEPAEPAFEVAASPGPIEPAAPEPLSAPGPIGPPERPPTPEPIGVPDAPWSPGPAEPAFEVAAREMPAEPSAIAVEVDETSLEELATPEPAGPAEKLSPLAAPSAGDDPLAAALEQITPRLREQLHDTLEKIAWESFGDVTEQIVRTALERVEQVAWEVIPQMAETLIREEIRRMKGETDS